MTASTTRRFSLPRPHSLMGQMLLAVAAALLLVQGLGAALVYRAQRDGYEAGMLNGATFNLLNETRGPGSFGHHRNRDGGDGGDGGPGGPRGPFSGPPPRGFRLEYSTNSPQKQGEARDAHAEGILRQILKNQNFPASEIVVLHRTVAGDPFAAQSTRHRAERLNLSADMVKNMLADHLLVVGVKPTGNGSWLVSRVRSPQAANMLLVPIILQTLVIYIVLVGAVALILRRITRPLAALTKRVEAFAVAPEVQHQLAPTGPEDMRRLIEAHNAMESRISAMLDEKDVMLGAIGHDLKTPLTALRVRIESVEDETERARMAMTIEDIVHTLDDILSLARVGRPSDPIERTEVSSLVISVVEEYEDMGEPVDLLDTRRIAAQVRPTWLRRALRNLISNALRYGQTARVSLEHEQGRAVILIDDDGPGIPETDIGSMMNAFTRGDPSRNSATGGAGLGLALARAIADQHGGALRLSNRRDAQGAIVGLTARLEIPSD
ncbi:ATP-binding protein [Novosphingobium sp. 9]|uniref:ATP-binding protein n=1 Tax=Novosphingobium sp. 9 TaxID=2025349 RepID=UPI0021B4DCFD|nr:ATP-binding protein [Novosphingobium sp. 9]